MVNSPQNILGNLVIVQMICHSTSVTRNFFNLFLKIFFFSTKEKNNTKVAIPFLIFRKIHCQLLFLVPMNLIKIEIKIRYRIVNQGFLKQKLDNSILRLTIVYLDRKENTVID